jgi:hypothetical protein
LEPQDNEQLALRKAISAHEQAEAALNDLTKGGSSPRYAAMLERIAQNLADLRAGAELSSPSNQLPPQ